MMATSFAARDGVVEMRHSGRLELANMRSVLISSQNTLLRAGAATNGVILAAGASFDACDVSTPFTIGKTGSSVATATHIRVIGSYSVL